MVDNQQSELDRVCESIARLITNPAARLWVTVESGVDEAGMVGTADAYLRLAVVALRLAGAAGQPAARRQQIAGCDLPVSTDFFDVFGPADVRVICGWVAPSEREVTALRGLFGDVYGAEPDDGA